MKNLSFPFLPTPSPIKKINGLLLQKKEERGKEGVEGRSDRVRKKRKLGFCY